MIRVHMRGVGERSMWGVVCLRRFLKEYHLKNKDGPERMEKVYFQSNFWLQEKRLSTSDSKTSSRGDGFNFVQYLIVIIAKD